MHNPVASCNTTTVSLLAFYVTQTKHPIFLLACYHTHSYTHVLPSGDTVLLCVSLGVFLF